MMLASGSLRARYIKDFMDCSLRGFIATVETSMLMFPVAHSLLVHNGTKHIANINRRINEFLMGFLAEQCNDKITFCHQVFPESSQAKKNSEFEGE